MIESFPATSLPSAALPRLPIVRVARKGVTALGIKLAGAGLALVLQISLARMLGFSGYGEYAYAFGWLQLTLVFAQGGFSSAALRYVGEYSARSEFSLLRGFLIRASRIALLESAVLAILMAGIAMAMRHRISDRLVLNLVIASASLPILSQFVLHSAVVRGLGQAILSMLTGMVQPILFVAALLSTAFMFRIGVSSSEAMLLNLGAAICALAVVVAVQRHYERSLGPGLQRTFRTGEWFSTATQMMFASGLIYLHARTGVVVSGLFLDARAAGTYAIMERVADTACLGLMSVNLLVGPSFAALYAQKKLIELQRYARLAAAGATAFMLFTVLPLVYFGKQILCLFGDEFVSGYPALLVLLASATINALCGSAVLLLNMTGHHRLNTLAAIGSLAANLTLSVLLVPRYGILGTAVANAVSAVLWSVSLLLLARWHLGIWSSVGRLDSRKMF